MPYTFVITTTRGSDMSNFISPNPNLQRVLDRADEAYQAVALESNDYDYVAPEDIYDALIAAWDYIIEVTDQPDGGYK
jgi:hypothetical protein